MSNGCCLVKSLGTAAWDSSAGNNAFIKSGIFVGVLLYDVIPRSIQFFIFKLGIIGAKRTIGIYLKCVISLKRSTILKSSTITVSNNGVSDFLDAVIMAVSS